MLPRQQILLKTFILENQSTQHSQVVISPVNISSKQIDLTQIFHKNIPNFQSLLFRIYDFRTNTYKKFIDVAKRDYHVPKELIHNGQAVVLIKYKNQHDEQRNSVRQTLSQSADDLKEIASDTSSIKKERAKERMISQVIEIVKRWRQLHLQKRGDKKISLQQAARLVGLPKKSLDDYYYQLRLGEKYSFDFKQHLYEGIGCLRNFLKDKRPRLKSQVSQKRPRNLKIIQEFDQLQIGSQNVKMQQQKYEQEEQQQKQEKRQQPNKNNKYNIKQYSNYNNKQHSNYNNYNNPQQNQQYTYNQNQQHQIKKYPIFQQPYYQLNQFQNNNQYLLQQQQQKQYNSRMFEQQDRDSIQLKLENQFYQDFGFMESYQDPFINLDGNFKKKKYENLFDQELFF